MEMVIKCGLVLQVDNILCNPYLESLLQRHRAQHKSGVNIP